MYHLRFSKLKTIDRAVSFSKIRKNNICRIATHSVPINKTMGKQLGATVAFIHSTQCLQENETALENSG